MYIHDPNKKKLQKIEADSLQQTFKDCSKTQKKEEVKCKNVIKF